MPFTFQCHESAIDKHSGQPVLIPVADYIRLSDGPDVVYIQHGEVYNHGAGSPLTHGQLPDWFWPAARALTPQARQAVEFTLPEDKIESISQVPQEVQDLLAGLPDHIRQALLAQASRIVQVETSPVTQYDPKEETAEPLKSDPEAPVYKQWTCDQCNIAIPLPRKGLHLAQHVRALKHSKKVDADGSL